MLNSMPWREHEPLLAFQRVLQYDEMSLQRQLRLGDHVAKARPEWFTATNISR
jgi:hypothetical protein